MKLYFVLFDNRESDPLVRKAVRKGTVIEDGFTVQNILANPNIERLKGPFVIRTGTSDNGYLIRPYRHFGPLTSREMDDMRNQKYPSGYLPKDEYGNPHWGDSTSSTSIFQAEQRKHKRQEAEQIYRGFWDEVREQRDARKKAEDEKVYKRIRRELEEENLEERRRVWRIEIDERRAKIEHHDAEVEKAREREEKLVQHESKEETRLHDVQSEQDLVEEQRKFDETQAARKAAHQQAQNDVVYEPPRYGGYLKHSVLNGALYKSIEEFAEGHGPDPTTTIQWQCLSPEAQIDMTNYYHEYHEDLERAHRRAEDDRAREAHQKAVDDATTKAFEKLKHIGDHMVDAIRAFHDGSDKMTKIYIAGIVNTNGVVAACEILNVLGAPSEEAKKLLDWPLDKLDRLYKELNGYATRPYALEPLKKNLESFAALWTGQELPQHAKDEYARQKQEQQLAGEQTIQQTRPFELAVFSISSQQQAPQLDPQPDTTNPFLKSDNTSPFLKSDNANPFLTSDTTNPFLNTAASTMEPEASNTTGPSQSSSSASTSANKSPTYNRILERMQTDQRTLDNFVHEIKYGQALGIPITEDLHMQAQLLFDDILAWIRDGKVNFAVNETGVYGLKIKELREALNEYSRNARRDEAYKKLYQLVDKLVVKLKAKQCS